MNLRFAFRPQPPWRSRQRGNTLFIVVASLVGLIGMAGLAIDLVALYTARSEAQRAADAAALAGAKAFVDFGCTSSTGGCVAGGPQQAPAIDRAIAAGSHNSVAGQAATVLGGDVTFDYSHPTNPTITVTVARDETHGGPVPTVFMRIFGTEARNVSATATAEAFNPSGSGIPVAAKCIKPWLLPNCDWNHPVSPGDMRANAPFCPHPDFPGMYASKYILDDGSIANPGSTPAGVLGQNVIIKWGDPHQAAAPSKFYPVYLPPGSTPSLCPACAPTDPGAGIPSGSLYQYNIACCNQSDIQGGLQTVTPIEGNMTGPTAAGVNCLIHETYSSETGPFGMDVFDPKTFAITAGKNNPLYPQTIDNSDSVVTIPVYNGETLCPGSSCPETIQVDVVGLVQIFVEKQDKDPSGKGPPGTVYAFVMNVSGFGSGGGGGGAPGGGPISGGGASPVPVRLIHK